MDLTARKYYASERARLAERRYDVEHRIAQLHGRLTELLYERALLDDLDQRLGSHLPAEAEDADVRRLDVA